MEPSYWLPALAFWALPAVYVLVRGIPAPRPAQVVAWGDVYGLELTAANRPVVERYLRRTKRLRTIGALGGLLFSIAFTAVTEGQASNSIWGNGLLMAAAGYVVGALVAEGLALEGIERMIVRRSQPVVAPDLLLADEAIRASSIHAMAGAGNALLLLGLSYLLSTLVTAAPSPLSWIFGILSFVALGLALSSWIDLGHPTSWR